MHLIRVTCQKLVVIIEFVLEYPCLVHAIKIQVPMPQNWLREGEWSSQFGPLTNNIWTFRYLAYLQWFERSLYNVHRGNCVHTFLVHEWPLIVACKVHLFLFSFLDQWRGH